MTRIILILALVPFLAACDMENILTGKKTSAQVEFERREALGLEPAENVWDAPLQFADIPEPEPCRERFRETVCRGGVEYPFEW